MLEHVFGCRGCDRVGSFVTFEIVLGELRDAEHVVECVSIDVRSAMA